MQRTDGKMFLTEGTERAMYSGRKTPKVFVAHKGNMYD